MEFTALESVSTNTLGDLTVIVADKAGMGVNDVEIELTGLSEGALVCRTARSGECVFQDLPVGATYVVSVLSEGCIFSEPVKVVVLKDVSATVHFEVIGVMTLDGYARHFESRVTGSFYNFRSFFKSFGLEGFVKTESGTRLLYSTDW